MAVCKQNERGIEKDVKLVKIYKGGENVKLDKSTQQSEKAIDLLKVPVSANLKQGNNFNSTDSNSNVAACEAPVKKERSISMPTTTISSEPPETYTVKEVSAILKISLRIAYELFKSKGFPATRIGSAHRVSKTAFNRWLENGSRIKLNS